MESDFYPVGGVIASGAVLPENSNWLYCDGRELYTSDYPELFNVIGYTYGGNVENQIFRIPDHRGRLLRGATRDTDNDPDASKRTTLAPAGEHADPREPGSVQGFATKRPEKKFSATFPHLPTGSKRSHGETKSDNTGPSGSSTRNTCTSGGDKETRPRNVDVNYYIKSRS